MMLHFFRFCHYRLYVPAGWLHGVINLQDTVALAKEIGTARELLLEVHPRMARVLGYPQQDGEGDEVVSQVV